jgi:cardiolipin synthase
VAKRSLTKKRLFGVDRSGPPPVQTLRGQPLNPWTLPNAIGYIRLALIPVFLIVALSSDDGHTAAGAIIFGVIGWSDYLDGITARITGQYSRLGVLLDPIADRLLIVSGMVVCWKFDLLPHWAIALLVLRELSMLVLGRFALRRGVEIQINWPGRLAVGPVLGAPFFAMCGLETLGTILLIVGLALAITATVLYLRYGLRSRTAPSTST